MKTGKRCILLVEDNANDILLTLRAFEKNDLLNDVVVVRDGEATLDYLFGRGTYEGRDIADLPQLILLDLKLQKIDGLETLRRIRENPQTKRVPVVILTASKEERHVREAYDLGVNSYVRKPVDFNEFTQVAKQLGVYWLLLNELATP